MGVGEVFARAGEVFLSRNDTYKDSWKRMNVIDILDGARYKIARAKAMLESNCPLEKVVDDLLDAMNYLAITVMKLDGEVKG